MDIESAERFLVERYDSRVANVAYLGGGDWSRAFSFCLDGRPLIARFGRHKEDFIKDRMAMAFTTASLPVPEVLEIGETLGAYYAISERQFGAFLETLDASGWRSILPALLRTLDTLREIEIPGSGVDWASAPEVPQSASPGWRQWLLESPEDRPGERVSGWREQLKQFPEIEDVFTRGERTWRSLVQDCPDSTDLRHIVHRDLLNRNVLVTQDSTRIAAVFDWGCSIAGDFVYEVAWFTFWASWYPALDSLVFRECVSRHCTEIGLRVDRIDQRLTCYELQIGMEHMAYAAFTRREDHLRQIARQTNRILERAG